MFFFFLYARPLFQARSQTLLPFPPSVPLDPLSQPLRKKMIRTSLMSLQVLPLPHQAWQLLLAPKPHLLAPLEALPPPFSRNPLRLNLRNPRPDLQLLRGPHRLLPRHLLGSLLQALDLLGLVADLDQRPLKQEALPVSLPRGDLAC